MVNNPIRCDGDAEKTIQKDVVESFIPSFNENSNLVATSVPLENDSEYDNVAPNHTTTIVPTKDENRFESTPLLILQPIHPTTKRESDIVSEQRLHPEQVEFEPFVHNQTINSVISFQHEDNIVTNDSSFDPLSPRPSYRINYPTNGRMTSVGNDNITSSLDRSTTAEPHWTVPFIVQGSINYNRTETTTTVTTTTSTSTGNSVPSTSTSGSSLRPNRPRIRRRSQQNSRDIESNENVMSSSLSHISVEEEYNRSIHPPTSLRSSLDAGMMTLRQWVRSRTIPSTPPSLASTSEVAARTLSATADPTQQQSTIRNERILQLLNTENGTSLQPRPPITPQSTPFRERRRIRSSTVAFERNPFMPRQQPQQQQHEQQQNDFARSGQQLANQYDVEGGSVEDRRRHRASSEPDAHHVREFFTVDGTSDSSDRFHPEIQRTMIRRRRSGQQSQVDDPGPSNQITPSWSNRRRWGLTSNSEFNIQQPQQLHHDPTIRTGSYEHRNVEYTANDPYQPTSAVALLGYDTPNDSLSQPISFPQTYTADQSLSLNATAHRFRVQIESLNNSGRISHSSDNVISESLFSTVDNETLSESAPLTIQSDINTSQLNDINSGSGEDSNSIVNSNNSTNGNNNNTGTGGRDEPNTNNRTSAEDPDRLARLRWIQINRRFQLVIAIVALLFSLLLFAILIGWVILTSAYVISIEKPCDVPLKVYYWLVTFQLLLDVFRNDIMRHVFQWDSNSGRQIPRRVVAYNMLYLLYAFLVLRLGVMGVFNYNDQISTCQETAHDFFRATKIFVSLSIAAWATIIGGYLLPFCVVACLLTRNGYNPASTGRQDDMRLGAGHAVFPTAYVPNGAPPDCIDHIPIISLSSFPTDYPKECCICMEDFKHDDILVRTNCQHVFHRACCREWLRQARTCPICRDDLVTSHLTETNNIADTDGHENNDDGDIEISSLGPTRPPVSNSVDYSLQPATIPIGPTGRPVVGLIRLIQNVSHGGIENSTGIANVTEQNETDATPPAADTTNSVIPPTTSHCPEVTESPAVENIIVSPPITDDAERGSDLSQN